VKDCGVQREPAGRTHSPFQVQEQSQDGHIAIALIGELDLLMAPSLEDRLDELAAAKQPVRLDLSRLEFIDSTGLRVLVRALLNARQNGWQLEIARQLTPNVGRVLKLVQVEHLFRGSNGAIRPDVTATDTAHAHSAFDRALEERALRDAAARYALRSGEPGSPGYRAAWLRFRANIQTLDDLQRRRIMKGQRPKATPQQSVNAARG
jgi:anti-sigma B factor antagonist